MKKIIIVLCLLLCLVGCSSNDNGASSSKKRVGVLQLIQHDALDKATQGFVDVLTEEYGYDVEIDVKNASGDTATCSVMANDFVAEGVDLIMANATPALQAVAHATNEIPVLGTSVTEYGVALDLDDYNGVVGGNISGTSDLAPLSEQAQMIIDLLPDVKTVGLLYCSAEANSIYQVKEVEKYLLDKGLTVSKYAFADSNDVKSVAEAACSEVEALYIPTDNTCASCGTVIANAANEMNIPIITGEKDTLLACEGLATLSIDYYELGRATGRMAVRVLNGEDISTMEVAYYDNPVKMYRKESAEKFNITMPDNYKAIEE